MGTGGWCGGLGGGTSSEMEALAARDSEPGHLCVSGCRDVITNTCFFNGAPGDLCDERREAKREGVMFRGVKEKRGTTNKASKCRDISKSSSVTKTRGYRRWIPAASLDSPTTRTLGSASEYYKIKTVLRQVSRTKP